MAMDEQEKHAHWRETLNKEWSKDFSSLSSGEVQKLIGLAFYQLFLIEVDSIKIISDIGSVGHYVRFEIEGEAYRDGASLDPSELSQEEE